MSMRGIIEFASWIADDNKFKAYLSHSRKQLEDFELTQMERQKIGELLSAAKQRLSPKIGAAENERLNETPELKVLSAREQQLRAIFVKKLDDYISSVMQGGDWILDDANFQSLLQDFPQSREALVDAAEEWKKDWTLDERVSKTIANILLGDM